MDGLGMGVGFTLALMALGATREFLSTGSLFEVKVVSGWSTDFMLPTSAAGAFIFLGLFLAGMNRYNQWQAHKQGKTFTPPAHLDCRHCHICDLGKDQD
jgi:electron transport complex protein RnfE